MAMSHLRCWCETKPHAWCLSHLSVLESLAFLHCSHAKSCPIPSGHFVLLCLCCCCCPGSSGLCSSALHHVAPGWGLKAASRGQNSCFQGAANPTVWATFWPAWPQTDHPSSCCSLRCAPPEALRSLLQLSSALWEGPNIPLGSGGKK